MSPRRTPLALRLLAVLAASVLLLGLVLVASRDRTPAPSDQPNSSQPLAPDDSATATPSDGVAVVVEEVDLAILDAPEAAGAAGGPALRAAASAVAAGAWDGVVDPAWEARLVELAQAGELPVYVASVAWDGLTGELDADLVILPPASTDVAQGLVLRFLPGADVLTRAGSAPDVTATQDGTAVGVTLDGAAATLTLDGDLAPDRPVRLRFSYLVPELGSIVDDGGPAGFGLLARTGNGAMLGHWLPLLTFDASPMVAFGDVGAFPPAVFSVTVETDDVVLTGGVDGPCPQQPACVRGRGVGLRDLAIATFLGTPVQEQVGEDVRAVGRGNLSTSQVRSIGEESAAALATFEAGLGPLPWPEFDVALLPLRAAAGMEFPGLVVVDPEYLDRLDGGFGTFVAVHEVAHQWFHALVGNSSLADAVVDESLAQYLSHWFYVDAYGQSSADGLFDRYLVGRYRSARQGGMVDIAPASPLVDFHSDDEYGPLVYARAPLAWTVAEAAAGRDVVRSFLADLVAQFGLREVTAGALVERAGQWEPAMGEVLQRWWFDPRPVDDQL